MWAFLGIVEEHGWKEKKEKESRKQEEKWDGEVVTTPARYACSLLHYHSEKSGYSAYRSA